MDYSSLLYNNTVFKQQQQTYLANLPKGFTTIFFIEILDAMFQANNPKYLYYHIMLIQYNQWTCLIEYPRLNFREYCIML